LRSAAKAPPETIQITIRLPSRVVSRLDAFAERQGETDRTGVVREAVTRFLSDEAPITGELARAVKPSWQNAVVRAFRDEGVWWTPLSEAFFWDMDASIAAKTKAVCVRVSRPPFIFSGPPEVFTGVIEWSGNVSTPEELYAVLRHEISKQVAGASTGAPNS
jgi:predicted transcriptional regulator